MKPKLLGVVGSVKKESLSRHAVKYVLDKAKELGAEVQIVDLLQTPLPIFNPDNRNSPEFQRSRNSALAI